MNVYFYANAIYQFAHVLPLYEKLPGIFLVNNYKTLLRFRKYLRGTACHGEKNLLRTPEVRVARRRDLQKLPSGILIYFANAINPDMDYKNLTTIFYEHGSSDKKYNDGSEIGSKKIMKYDYIFLWGPKNQQKVLDAAPHIATDRLIEIGGFRFDKFQNHEELKNKRLHSLGLRDTSRKTVLYAPTWAFGNGTIKTLGEQFIREITQEYNLILRPHHHDRWYGWRIYQQARLKGNRHIYYSQPADIIGNDILYDFALADVMISDMSSVVYEFLITGKPIVLIDNKYENRLNMPGLLNLRGNSELYDGSRPVNEAIKRSLSEHQPALYDEMLHHCFYSVGSSAVDKASAFVRQLIRSRNNETAEKI